MKYLSLIAALLILSAPVMAQEPVADTKVVIIKTTREQRALTELLSARIKFALEGERYVLESCKGKTCGEAKR